MYKVKTRIINYDIDQNGRPNIVLIKRNGYVLTAQTTFEPKQYKGKEMNIKLIGIIQQKQSYLQHGYKIHSNNKYIVGDYANAKVKKFELEKWLNDWGIDKLIATIIYFMKLDPDYQDGGDLHSLIDTALSHSLFSSNFQSIIKGNLFFYDMSTELLPNTLEFL